MVWAEWKHSGGVLLGPYRREHLVRTTPPLVCPAAVAEPSLTNYRSSGKPEDSAAVAQPSADHSMGTLSQGDVTAAMCYRVKYRKLDQHGKPLRMFVPILALAVHPKNRGGVYPAGSRLKELCYKLGVLGFRKEEPNHALVAVEEPEDAAAKGETIHQYNVKKTRNDVDLCDLFLGDGIQARLGTLSHSHCMLVLRAWINCCLWSIPL